MSAESKLVEMGIVLPEVVAPLAAYVPAVATANLVFTAGQLPMVDGSLPRKGKVGERDDLVSPADAAGLARICALNALAAVRAEIGSLDRIVRIVKVGGFVNSDPQFFNHSVVVNGASDLIVDIFGEAGRHARTSVGVAVLPLDSPVEVELIVEYQ